MNSYNVVLTSLKNGQNQIQNLWWTIKIEFYVDKNGQWKFPLVSIPNIEEEEKKILTKIKALNIIFEYIQNSVYVFA